LEGGVRLAPTRPIVAVAAAAYAAFTLLALARHGGDPLWFVWIGERWAHGALGGSTGYDGQFVLYIARDGWDAAPHLDAPGYRFGRIGYPLAVRWLSGGQAGWLPWSMLAINYAAVVAATAVLAGWLARRATSPWWALVYAGSVGLLFAYSRDTTEPLAYGLAAGGVIAWMEDRRLAGALLLAAGGLTRETTLLFIAALALPALLDRRWRALPLLALAALPTLAWHAYLAGHFANPSVGVAGLLTPLAFLAALRCENWEIGRLLALVLVGLPTLALLPGALAWVWRQPRNPLVWLIALNALLVLTLPVESYLHVLGAARLSLGLIVALLLAFPDLSSGLRVAIAACCVGPTLLWAPVMLYWAPWTAVR
jgi:hypothetical protein